MSTSNRNSAEPRLKMYEVRTKFGRYGYVMASSKEEASHIARPYLPLSESRADWFAVNEISGLELVES